MDNLPQKFLYLIFIKFNQNTMKRLLLTPILVLGLLTNAQQKINKEALQKISLEQKVKQAETKKFVEKNSKEIHIFPKNIAFEGLSSGIPVYLAHDSHSQITSMNSDYLNNNTIPGVAVTGDGMVVYIWDEGSVRTTHHEFTGRVTNAETTSNSDHSTGVAGVIMGEGINANAKGIAYAANLTSFNFNNNLDEIATASQSAENADYMISNHSYGSLTGWYYNTSDSNWYWWGYPNVSETESALFGFYTEDDATWDAIAYNAPQHSMFKSAGNEHTEGPDGTVDHYTLDENNSWVLVSGTFRPKDCAETGGYDCLSFSGGVSKNTIIVGAINPISGDGRYETPSNVTETWYTSFGPTDDGRIKPDVTAIGSSVVAPNAGNDDAYSSWSGTSFSTPAVTGVGVLLEQIQGEKTDGNFYLSSDMMRALLTHTANESGDNPGPDYKFGYGLVDAFRAAETLLNVNSNSILQNQILNNGETKTIQVTAKGDEPLKVSIAWLDPAGTPLPQVVLNDRTPMLVNDLDLRVTHENTTYFPWKLDPDNPSAAATQEDNLVDNLEQVLIENPIAGQQYTITVSHKGSLVTPVEPIPNPTYQNFAIIMTGVDAPLSTQEMNLENAISLYPNPVSDKLNFQLNKNLNNPEVKIFNQAGQIVYQNQFKSLSETKSIDMSSLPSGIYMVYIKSDEGVITKKIIKK